MSAHSLRLELQQVPRRACALFTEEGRAKLARLVVHGSDGCQTYYDHQIQFRVEQLLERIAKGIEEGKY